MGWISKRHMQTGGSIGGRRKKTYPKDGAPLRRIVAILRPSRSIFDKAHVRLECGHEDYSWGGIRARCSQCRKASGPSNAP